MNEQWIVITTLSGESVAQIRCDDRTARSYLRDMERDGYVCTYSTPGVEVLVSVDKNRIAVFERA